MTAAGRLRWPALITRTFAMLFLHSQEHCSHSQLAGADFNYNTQIC